MNRNRIKGICSDKIIFFIGFYFLLLIASLLFMTSLLFFIKIPVTGVHLFLAVLISSAVFLFIEKADKKTVWLSILIALILFVIMTVFSSAVYDISCDGNTYHKAAVGYLKNGWNPVYQDSLDFNRSAQVLPDDSADLWVDHYAKASWILGACVYSITNAIETGKVFSWLMIIALFCISYDYLSKRVLNKWQSAVAAFLIAFNPITCAQLTTFYIDGFLCVSVFTGIFFLIAITDQEYEIRNEEKWLGLFCAIMLCVNIKFTGLAFIGLVSIIFYIYWLITKRKSKDFAKYAVRLTSFFIASVILSVGAVGYSSYIKNIIYHGNPFYPLFGGGAMDIITPYAPLRFKYHGSIHNVLSSIFSVTSNDSQILFIKYKLPFTVSKSEIDVLKQVDLRIGGFGVLFSGIFIISVILLAFCLIRSFKKDNKAFTISSLILTAVFISELALKESWWARYNPLTYLIPILSLILFFKFSNSLNYRRFFTKGIAALFAVIMLTNIGYFLYYRVIDVKNSFTTSNQLKELKQYSNGKTITVCCLYGDLFNLKDIGIPYQYVEESDDAFKGIDCNTIFYK